MRTETITYSSSVDGTSPLYVDVAYDDTKSNLPVLVVMHGYGGDRTRVFRTIQRWAQEGLFAVAPDMRGHGDSAGKRDSGGVEIMDIYDAIECIRRSFGNRIDPKNINIVGYSGGGGNVFSCVTKFPNLFRSANAFFGISDYAYWYHTVPDYAPQIAADVAGSPEEVPDQYAARNSLMGVVNNPYTTLQLFWDEEEEICPPYFNIEYRKAARALGYSNVIDHESRIGDPLRWIHAYPEDHPDLIQAEERFIPGIISGIYPEPGLQKQARMVVLGYIKTKMFTIWLGDGQNAVVECSYALDSTRRRFFMRRRTSDPSVRATLAVSLKGMRFPIKVYRNDAYVKEITEGERFTYERLHLDDRVVLESA